MGDRCEAGSGSDGEFGRAGGAGRAGRARSGRAVGDEAFCSSGVHAHMHAWCEIECIQAVGVGGGASTDACTHRKSTSTTHMHARVCTHNARKLANTCMQGEESAPEREKVEEAATAAQAAKGQEAEKAGRAELVVPPAKVANAVAAAVAAAGTTTEARDEDTLSNNSTCEPGTAAGYFPSCFPAH